MKREEKFRTCLFGGYNKEDVQSYIASLEQEIERLAAVETTAELLEKSVNELLEKQKAEQDAIEEQKAEQAAMEKTEAEQKDGASEEKKAVPDIEEIEALREKAQKYEESYDAIKQLLLDSRIEAQVILTDARQQSEKLKEQMDADARLQYDQMLLKAEEEVKKTKAAAEVEINEEKRAVRKEKLEAEQTLMEAKKQAEALVTDAENRIAKRRRESIEQVDKAFKAIQNQLHAVLLKTSEDFEYAVEAEFSMPVLEENKAASDTSALQETDSSVTVSECEVTEEKA